MGQAGRNAQKNGQNQQTAADETASEAIHGNLAGSWRACFLSMLTRLGPIVRKIHGPTVTSRARRLLRTERYDVNSLGQIGPAYLEKNAALDSSFGHRLWKTSPEALDDAPQGPWSFLFAFPQTRPESKGFISVIAQRFAFFCSFFSCSVTIEPEQRIEDTGSGKT